MPNRNSLDNNPVASATRVVAVNTATATTFDPHLPKGLYITGAGNLQIINQDTTTATVTVPANFIFPVGVFKLDSLANGTTATGIFALFDM